MLWNKRTTRQVMGKQEEIHLDEKRPTRRSATPDSPESSFGKFAASNR